MRLLILFITAILFSSCKTEQELPKNKFFEPQNESFTYSGRILPSSEGTKLIASASSVKADVYGDTVTIFMKSDGAEHHYVAVELNDEYKGRFRITKDSLKFPLPKKDSANTLAIYKETEASNGLLIFNGLRAQKIEKTSEEKRAKIEFIGDSITCGMGADTSEIDCEEGEWYDQHSAYMAYGPRVARMLDVDFEVNCVSGMGMYRNWNDEDQPVMPQVYPYLHLNGEQGKRAEIKKDDVPDIVSIALGTNDFSVGDGKKERLPFKEESFKENYIGFIKALYEVYPDTQIALISSPMTGEKEGQELIRILKDIKNEFPDRSIAVFEFEKMNASGCTGHPALEDHELMAEKLLPFYQKLLNKNTHE
ncbi:GDSL-type esterase/lipase family protein [Salinimicrobium sp. WS361]|uniref:SGNH/GDSL hydrolase family protein n=1 Tax=Salinimicrobium sp. WS361 TaxID=3425123 RepID=UPI003D6FDCCD